MYIALQDNDWNRNGNVIDILRKAKHYSSNILQILTSKQLIGIGSRYLNT